MKSCPKCKISYPDTENYCIECGTRLVLEKPREIKRMPVKPGEVISLKKKIEKIEKKIIPYDQMKAISNKLGALEQRMDATMNQLKQIERKANKITKIKFLPKEEAMSLLSDIGELRSRTDAVDEKISGMGKLEIPKLEIPKELKIKVNNIEKKLDMIHLPVLKNRIGKIEKNIKETTDELNRVEKKASRIGRIKFLPKEEAISLVGEIGELERKMEAMDERIAELGTVPENIEEITGYGRSIETLMKRVQATNSGVKGLTGFIKENEKTLDGIENNLKNLARKTDLKDLQDNAASNMDSLKEGIGRKISSNSARTTRLSRRIAEQDKTLADFVKTKERLVLEQEKRLDKIDKKINTRLKTTEKRIVKASTKRAEDIKGRVEGELEAINESLARREKFENRMSQDIGNLKNDKGAIGRIRERVREQEKSLGKLVNFKRDLRGSLEDFKKALMADQEKRFKSLDKFREKIMLITGLALEQEAKSRKIRSRLKKMIEEKMADIRGQNDLLIKKTDARLDETTAAISNDVRDLRSRLDEELQLINEALATMEKGISAQISSLADSSVSKGELEDLNKEFGAEKARVVDIRDQLIEQGKVLEEIEGIKENLIAEQRQKINEIETQLRHRLDEVNAEGKKILADAEHEIKSDFEMKLQNMDNMKKRLEVELDALNKNLEKRKEFESHMNEDIEDLKADIDTLDTEVKKKFAGEKIAMKKMIETELEDLGRAKREFYERLSLLKESINKTIRTAVKKEMADFEELKVKHGKMMNSMGKFRANMNMSVEKLRKDLMSEKAKNEKLREEAGMELDRVRMIGIDSQEKLSMVKNFIDNVEKRFRVEIESLEEKLEKIIKIQEKQELERISPLKFGKERVTVKKPRKK